jgi:hypothetical protein
MDCWAELRFFETFFLAGSELAATSSVAHRGKFLSQTISFLVK